ncbi:uncharacterized protein Fot_42571 [Forsythia ovata]|uniref:FAF domain-containing protein n=1 Tax=Forsythia ovata TaxID=205694 RepID=A0ABD1RM26_9LAMI
MQSPELGDYIGAESYVDFVMDFNTLTAAAAQNGDSGRRQRVVEKEKKEYPPPISPWMMKKYCTGDGRLIIEDVKVKSHEYFQAHRANGRLVLNLVTLYDDVLEHAGDEEDMDGIDGFDCEENVNQEDGEGPDVMKETEEDDQTVEKESVKCGGGTKCVEYSSMEANSCGFGVEVAAFNPVHS